MKVKLTPARCRDFNKPGGRLTDTEVKGFALEVDKKTLAKSLVFKTEIGGRQRQKKLGDFPGKPIDEARQEARRYREQFRVGDNPLAAEKAAREAETVNELCDQFLEQHVDLVANGRHKLRPPTRRDYRLVVNKYIRPSHGSLKIGDVGSYHIESLHKKVGQDHARQANMILSVEHKMFELAIKWAYRTKNPCHGIERFHEEKREEYMTVPEIYRLLDVLDKERNRSAAGILTLLTLSGARKSEALKATWGEFDLEAGTWTKPSHHTKTKKKHILPLIPPALDFMRGIQRPESATNEHPVFPGKDPTRPVVGLTRIWHRIRSRAGLDKYRIHDLRHSFASLCASLGIPQHTVGQLLGHVTNQSTFRYSHLYQDHLRQAAEQIGEVFALRAGPESDPDNSKVVPIHGAK